ncbi:NAD(P)-dependent alcohol dehydrogenase [Mycolicibacterium smegmatis]|uniref:NAD(P)-dependent alcohol dehydrogenase n=1 Tax=Mycolicibacterium smegmatis TaxID=1772 RepID=UPI0020A5622C|nr:NAD(P)-dependent alcohol dehydrogenase [Mycolicibacterium smegmatis]MCP2627402.1 NAD(P)-dependent alcohol dehydrogenase [Mycolicibacterium smegmatis]
MTTGDTTATMAAAAFRRYGAPQVLEVLRVPVPQPGDGQVLVRVEATTVNGGELAQRQGKLRALARVTLPRFVGVDFAGEIVALGQDVTEFAVGERVWGTVDERGPIGSAAEYVPVEARRIARSPDGWSAEDAVTLVAGGATALVGLRDQARLHAGERLLVRGAAGGVGSVAVQIGRMLGAHVTALTSASSADFVLRLGADEVIDYRTPVASLGSYDVIFDTRGNELWSLRRHLTPRGRMVTIAFDVDHKLRSLGVIAASRIFGERRIRFFLGHPTGVLFEELTQITETGHLQPVADSVFPLERIAEAHAKLENGGVHGKVVISIGAAVDDIRV